MSAGFFPGTEAFWHARDVTYARRKDRQNAAQAGTALKRLSVLSQHHEDLWRRNINRYLSTHPRMLRTLGNFDVVNDPQLSRDVMATIAAIEPALAAAFDKHFSSLAFAAWRAWPVKSGWSQSLIRLGYQADGNTFVGRLSSEAPYTYFIKDHPHRHLIALPGKKMAFALTQEVQEIGKLRDGGP